MPDPKDDNSNKIEQGKNSIPTEPATVVIPTVANPLAQPPLAKPPLAKPERAKPQRVGAAAAIPPAQPGPTRIEPAKIEPARVGPTAPEPTKRGGKAWYIAAATAAVAIVAAVGVAIYVSSDDNAGGSSPQAQVQSAISTYVDALNSGDLATLRTATCGSLADYYRTIPDDAFAQVHLNAVAQKSIPQVSAVDAVRITDNTAIAQVQASIPATGEQSWRTFDLERADGTWKVCDPSQATG